MEEYKGNIISIKSINSKQFEIKFVVFNEKEIDQILNFHSDNLFMLHNQEYTFIIEEDSMIPINKLQDCMEVYHNYEYSNNLNPELRRMWNSARIADNIAHKIISSELLKSYSIK